jgi:hypothetical protein
MQTAIYNFLKFNIILLQIKYFKNLESGFNMLGSQDMTASKKS